MSSSLNIKAGFVKKQLLLHIVPTIFSMHSLVDLFFGSLDKMLISIVFSSSACFFLHMLLIFLFCAVVSKSAL